MKFEAAPYKARVDALMAKMTTLEKIGQLALFGSMKDVNEANLKKGLCGGVLNATGAENARRLQKIAVEETRLGIPLLVGDDVIHGFRTTFPIPLAGAASFDMEKIEESERIAAKEAYAEGVNWIYAPMVDLCREPRWGRIAEGAGEDPYLGGCVAAARVRGLQSTNPDTGYPYAGACFKHFAGYGLSEGGRDYESADISERTLFGEYMKPYEAAIEAGAVSAMSSFNTLGGEPVSGSRHYLTEVLRERFGFEGFVVSDWESVLELIHHRTAASPKDAARIGALAGCDMDMHSNVYIDYLPELVESDADLSAAVEESCRRILTVKFALGLFEHPYHDASGRAEHVSAEHRRAARDLAAASAVLLKNDGTLPLSKNGRYLLTGPLATSQHDCLGMWSCRGEGEDVVTVLDGLRETLGDRLSYATGLGMYDADDAGFAEAGALAAGCDAIVYVCGEDRSWTGEAHCKTDISLPLMQTRYLEYLKTLGIPVVTVLLVGRPVACPELHDLSDAVLLSWHAGIETGHAVSDVLFGDVPPSGKLPVTFPRTTGQIPIFYSHLSSGRPRSTRQRYLDCPNAPLYPFGYGLSYGAPEYGAVTFEKDCITADGELVARVTVTNASDTATDEVAQVYFRDDVSSCATPERRLCAFRKFRLGARETVELEFRIPAKAFAFMTPSLCEVVEPGTFTLFIGRDSEPDNSAVFSIE